MKDKTNLEGHRSEGQVPGHLARAAWAVTRKISEGIECGETHQLLSRRTKLVGVSLASGFKNGQALNSLSLDKRLSFFKESFSNF